jgi:hypothetical protein
MRVQSGGLGGISLLREEAEPPPGVKLLALSRCRKPNPLPPCTPRRRQHTCGILAWRWQRGGEP